MMMDQKAEHSRDNTSCNTPTEDRTVPDQGDDPVIDEIGGSSRVLEEKITPDSIVINIWPSKDVIVVGEAWSVFGEIKNGLTTPIWISDVTTRLTPATEVWGDNKKSRDVVPHFPTSVPNDEGHEVVRIEPGSTYSFLWIIDPNEFDDGDDEESDNSKKEDSGDSEKDNETKGERNTIFTKLVDAFGSIANFYSRSTASIKKEYIYFSPGKYKLSTCILVWPVKPILAQHKSNVPVIINRGDAFSVTKVIEREFELSQFIILLGSIIGGVACFILQYFIGKDAGIGFASGAGSAIFLSGTTAILASRIGKSDFIVSLNIRDFWGAVATGVIIQLLGYQYILSFISKQ